MFYQRFNLEDIECQMKMVSSLWQPAKISYLENIQEILVSNISHIKLIIYIKSLLLLTFWVRFPT